MLVRFGDISTLVCDNTKYIFVFLLFQTVIECLRYVTTGETPPLAKTAAAFIHDPKVCREVENEFRLTRLS